jgi:hypothetical protein
MKRFLILPALCLFLAAHRAVAALTFAPISATAGLHRRQLLKSLGTRDLRRDPAPLLRRYFSALHGR